jgi:glycine hydroxymethyltransferase
MSPAAYRDATRGGLMESAASGLDQAEQLATVLRRSVSEQAALLRSSLVLNPVENFPLPDDLAVTAGPMHGLYNSDRQRTRDERLASDHQFAGRQRVERDCRAAYGAWARALGAQDATLRLLSGLHAHTVLFMSLTTPGQRVLLLPVEAGGHLSGRRILERLGLEVVEMATDDEQMCVDLERTAARCEAARPDVVFVDRSEGLVVEDFSQIRQLGDIGVFDASQYLTNVLVGDHPNPFAAGFDLLVSSVHKNFPGPQKALLATRELSGTWRQVLSNVSTYVSNMHVASTYAATLTLGRRDWLATYSSRMLSCAQLLEHALIDCGVPAVARRPDAVPTHHLWIREGTRERAFETFEALERCRILTNFRKLPYRLGFGVRLGTSAAVRVGLREVDVPRLAQLIADIRRDGATTTLQDEARAFNEAVWERADEGV